jgi:serine protease Do
MKKILYILFIITISVGCAQKPATPKGNNNYPVSSPSTRPGSYSNNGRPPLPHQQNGPSKQTGQTVETGNTTSGRVLSPSEIFEKLSSAVFKIHTSTGYQGFQGSGFFISSNGIAVSNYHVFQGTAVGYEDIILSDGSTYKVTEVYHKSQENDFIIFKVGVGRKVNYVKIANNTPKVGEKIYTIGSPRGLDNTFSSGEISQIRENGKILQISAPIDHGSSGGVLLNSKGEAVGITSGGIDDSGANLNYAWNIQLIKPYIP